MNESVNISNAFTGQTQSQRVLPALSPATFQVDDRDMADFLAFTVKFSKAFKYINLQNKPEGTWQPILLSDPTLLLAYIMKTNHFMEFSRYLDYADGIQALKFHDDEKSFNHKKVFTQQFFSIGFHIILRINRWYKLANQSLQHHPFRDYLHQLIVEEGHQALQEYYHLYFSLSEWINSFKNESYAKLEDLDRIWRFNPFPCVGPLTIFDPIQVVVEEGLSKGQKLFHLQDKIIKAAGNFFETSLQTSEILPHVGLLLTFIDLFKFQQDDLNQLTEAHLDFYYNSILGFQPLPALADTTLVSFQLAKGFSSFSLESGTALSAGKDTLGNPVSFLTQQAININAGVLSQYLTTNFLTDDNALGTLVIGSLKKFDTLAADSWPFFGDTKAIAPNYTVVPKTDAVGFSISCPDLILNAGERSFTIKIYKNSETTPVPPPSATGLATQQLFDIQLTTTKGWTTFKGEDINISKDLIQFTLRLSLSDPSIIAYSKKIHGASGYETTWPICKVSLAKDLTNEQFDILSAFTFQEIIVSSQTNEMKNVVLQNDRGKVSTKASFLPFGNMPFPESNLYIGHQEFFVKPLQSIHFNIEWDHLPDDFTEYYYEYPDYYENESFLANLSFLNEEEVWKELNYNQEDTIFSLFTEDIYSQLLKEQIENRNSATAKLGPLTVPLANPRHLDFTVAQLLPVQTQLDPITAYSQASSSAFFKLTFVEPSQGFGSNDYAQTLSKITLENGQAIIYNAKNSACKPNQTATNSLCEDFYAIKNQLIQLGDNYQNEVKKLQQVESLLAQLESQVKDIIIHDDLPEVRKTNVQYQITFYQEKIELVFHNFQNNLYQILQTSIKNFDQFIKNNADKIKALDAKTKAETNGEDKDHQGVVEKIIDGLESALLPSIGKKVVDSGKNILGGLKEKLVHSVSHLAQEAVSGIGTRFVNFIKSLNPFKRKKKDDAAKSKDALAKTDGTTTEPTSTDDTDPLDVANLLKELEGQLTTILAHLNDYTEKLVDSISSTVAASPLDPMEDGADFNTATSPLDTFKTDLMSLHTPIQDYISTGATYSLVFTAYKSYFDNLLSEDTCPCIPLKPLPNKPYIPKIKSLTVDYQSESQWSNVATETPSLAFQFYQHEPFGTESIDIGTTPINLLPDLKRTPYTYLGFKQLTLGDTLTILINVTSQIKAISAQSTRNIQFEYLSKTGWSILELDADGTYTFEQSGIIQFVIPEDMTDQSTLMPTNFFWLRISQLPVSTNSTNTTLDQEKIMINFLSTQAVVVERDMQTAKDIKHIPVGTIKNPINKIPAIKKILQPQTSTGGRPIETKSTSNQRTAYRLNNKNRAVQPEDLENLILQNFSELYRATAIPMGYTDPSKSNLVKVVVVPLTALGEEHAYRPLVAPTALRNILEFSTEYSPPAIDIEIDNPDFLELQVSIQVLFTSQNSNGLLSQQLNTDLTNFLSPWLKDNPFDEPTDPWDTTALRTFILARDYVANVGTLDFKLMNKEARDKYTIPSPIDPGNINNPMILLVPALQHKITDLSTVTQVANDHSLHQLNRTTS